MRTLSISLMNSCPFFHLSFPPKGAQLTFQISLPRARSLWSSPISRNCHWRPFSNPNSSSISKNPRSVSCSFPSSSVSPPLAGDDFEVELSRLLVLLPEEMCRKVREHAELHHLIEIVMDLGRKPLARFPSGDFLLSDRPITRQDLQHATSQICSMLKKKHDEAKEILVRAVVNNNLLLMLNHPIYEDKIRKIQKFASNMMSKESQS